MSYPDLIEQDDRYWVTETQKSVARIHELDSELIQGTWDQVEDRLPADPVTSGCLVTFESASLAKGELSVAKAVSVEGERGFAVDLWLTVNRFQPGQILMDARDSTGSGWSVSMGENKTLSLQLSDGQVRSEWSSDPDILDESKRHHVAFVVDGGPNIITVIIDGNVCDGGNHRQFGWGRFDARLGDLSGSQTIQTDTRDVTLHQLRIYDRYLRTAEVIQNYRAGIQP
jgi:hypothetical protein